jgi:thiamine pyrophosphokinase
VVSFLAMYTVIVANAPDLDAAPYQEQIRAADLLIAADGGALPLLRLGLLPQIVIGDLDSLDAASATTLAECGVELRRFRRDKDETDLELALLHAAERGADTIDILGALGGRWDHTLANVALLALPDLRGRRARLLADRQELFLVRDSAAIAGAVGDTVSLLPLTGEVRGITTRGLLYQLEDATLSYERARGVSNVLLEPPGNVTLREGLLLVVHHDDGGMYQFYHDQPA